MELGELGGGAGLKPIDLTEVIESVSHGTVVQI